MGTADETRGSFIERNAASMRSMDDKQGRAKLRHRPESKGAEMAVDHKRILCVAALAGLGPFVLPSAAQQPADSTVKVVQITGLPGIKNKTSGKLLVEGGSLHFTHGQTKSDLAATSVGDVVTGADSQRLIHGTLGTLTMLAPYGSGRFLSLFRTKLDTLTIKFSDADGGLHGAIFAMPAGQAEMIKKQLLAQGAHTSVAPEAASNDALNKATAKEQKQ
jgi:hypothetical protein